MTIIKYITDEEGQQIIADKTSQGYTLIDVQNIIEGNFLGFLEPNEVRPEAPKTEVEKLQEELNVARQDNTDVSEIILDLGIRLQILEGGM